MLFIVATIRIPKRPVRWRNDLCNIVLRRFVFFLVGWPSNAFGGKGVLAVRDIDGSEVGCGVYQQSVSMNPAQCSLLFPLLPLNMEFAMSPQG